MEINETAKKKEPFSKLLKRIKDHWVLYLFLLPAVLTMILFHYRPTLEAFLLAFKKFQFKKTVFEMQYIGFSNFETFFNTPNCWQLIKNTLIISLMKIILGFPFPIMLAINAKPRMAGIKQIRPIFQSNARNKTASPTGVADATVLSASVWAM